MHWLRFQTAWNTLLLMTFALGMTFPLAAQLGEGRLQGTVTLPNGEAGVGVEVRLVGTPRFSRTDQSGRFQFEELLPGRYTVIAESHELGRAMSSIELRAGDTAELRLVLENQILHRDAITVTAAPIPSLASEVSQPVAVLEGPELLGSLAMSLGDTLARQPGIATNYSGPGSSRPIIRGLGGDRIRILDHGLGLGDVAASSPHHAVAFEPLSAERIEVVRGPTALLYGATAVGGVVNLLDESIPDRLPDQPVTGTLTLLGGTAADERSGALALTGKAGSLAWTASFAGRDAGDVAIPGFAESDLLHEEHDPEEERVEGILPNSFVESTSGRVGLSWLGANGFLGFSAFGFDTRYGVPGEGHAHEHERTPSTGESSDHDHESIAIDLNQRRLDFRSEWGLTGGLERIKIRAGAYDYQHEELEGEEVATRFQTEGLEGRVELVHRQIGPLRGVLGLQLEDRDYRTEGEEGFIPTNRSDQLALFFVEELPLGPVALEFGGRYERATYDVERTDLPDRSFSGFSGSVALRWKASETFSTRAALSRTEIAPNPDALYADGLHAAAQRFEFGDATLGKETSLALDAGFRIDTERLRFELSAFLNRVDDFVLERILEEEVEDFPAIQYTAADVDLRGFEADLHWTLLHRHPQHLELHLSTDFVRAEERADGTPLARIPPMRYGVALEYQGRRWFATLSGQRVEEPDRLAPLETDTPAYTWVDATVGYRIVGRRRYHDLILIGRNLTDAEARVHSSFLKDFAPLPGRDLRLAYRFSF